MEKILILQQILLAFAAAKLLGRLAARVGIPAVVGELAAGIILGPHLLDLVHESEFLESLAELGVIILLFMAGMESRLKDIVEVGRTAVVVAILGFVFPFTLGYGASAMFGYPLAESLFVATASVATSVGITIKVLRDMGYVRRRSAHIIIAAAILDDIFGLIVLAVVKGVSLGTVNTAEVGLLAVQAIGFVVFVALLGPQIVRRRAPHMAKRRIEFIFELALIFCLGLSLLAEFIGLAAIVGAFLAGLVLSELHEFHPLEEKFLPLSWFFVPFFFVLMGTFVDLRSFIEPSVMLEVAVFTVVAIIAKAGGAWIGAYRETRATANEVAVGMVPRGEVGIVVAGIGLSAGAISTDVYISVIGMVILTTVVAPFLIKVAFRPQPSPTGSPA